MFNQRGGGGSGFRNRINQIAQRFRQAGATSPATAKTAEELGLPSRFQEAMHRRLGQTGIFVEVNGKYYLDEARLAQVNKSNSGRGVGGMGGRQSARETLFGLRMARLVIGIVVILLIFSNLFFLHSFMTWFLIGGLLLIVVVISVLQLYYLSKARRMWRSSNFPSAVSEVQMSIN